MLGEVYMHSGKHHCRTKQSTADVVIVWPSAISYLWFSPFGSLWSYHR